MSKKYCTPNVCDVLYTCFVNTIFNIESKFNTVLRRYRCNMVLVMSLTREEKDKIGE